MACLLILTFATSSSVSPLNLYIVRDELPNFAKSIRSLSKLLSSDSHLAGDAGDANLASYELKPPFNDVLKPYNPSLLNLANHVTAIAVFIQKEDINQNEQKKKSNHQRKEKK